MRAKYQKYIDATDELCRRDVGAEAMRKGLLEAELAAHNTCGDAPDRVERPIFLQVDVNKEERIAVVSGQRDLTATLAFFLCCFDGDKRKALITVAQCVEEAGEDVRSYTPIPNLPPHLATMFREWCQKWAAGEDLWPVVGPGFTFYGHAWMYSRLPTEPPEVVRTVHLVTRAGEHWIVCRERDEEPYSFGLMPTGTPRMVGVVPHCLTRIINFGLVDPLPVPPTRVTR